jgi:hypothetical protein
MGMFDGIETAKPTESTPFFLEGSYKVQLVECKSVVNRNKEFLFIINGKILESTNPERKPGMLCGQIIKLSGVGSDSGLGNVKAFVARALQLDPSNPEDMAEITSDFMETQVVSNIDPKTKLPRGNEFAGMVFALSCRNKLTKKGTNFTMHDWTLVKDGE